MNATATYWHQNTDNWLWRMTNDKNKKNQCLSVNDGVMVPTDPWQVYRDIQRKTVTSPLAGSELRYNGARLAYMQQICQSCPDWRCLTICLTNWSGSWWRHMVTHLWVSVVWACREWVDSVESTGLTHAKLVSLTSPSCSGWSAPMNTPQGQQRTAEQRWLHWLQCLIRKWSCVNHQFQFHTQIAYKPTYKTHDLCYCYFLIIGTYIRFNRTNSAIYVFGTLAQPFDFRQWLHVCAVKVDTSYFGDLFSTCQLVLGHPCHIWCSLGPKSLTHNHSTHAGPVKICCVMTGVFDRK